MSDDAFVNILRTTRNLGCVDHRDRIYGLLGLAKICQDKGLLLRAMEDLFPDYSKPFEELFIDIACLFVKAGGATALFAPIVHDKEMRTALPKQSRDWEARK